MATDASERTDNESYKFGGTQPDSIYIKTAITDGTNTAAVNSEGQLHVVLMGQVDNNNSSSTPLTADAVFTGTAINTLDFGFIFITIFSDKDSATDGLSFQQSPDGTNWDNTDDFNYLANTGKTYSIQPAAKWFRIVYTNSSTNQGVFRLQTVFKKTSSLPSSHRISDNLSSEDDASLQIAVIKGQKPNGDYTDFNATIGGNFKVSLEEFDESFLNNPLPTNSTKDNDKLHDYKVSDIEELSTITYCGYLKKDGAWYILKIENDTDFRYVKGDSGYDFSNRGSESYNLFSEIF